MEFTQEYLRNERIQEMAEAIALGMVIYEKAKAAAIAKKGKILGFPETADITAFEINEQAQKLFGNDK